MRRLLLIRHAKSSWNFPELSDHERPLKPRGERDIHLMSQRLQSRNEQLDAIVSSSAVRALQFAKVIADSLAVKLTVNSDYYTFSAADLLEQLYNLPEREQRVAVVAHNPAITDLANQLSNQSIANIPTSGMVAFGCDIQHWHHLSKKHCHMDYFDYPKQAFEL